jgi:hypothetical protein
MTKLFPRLPRLLSVAALLLLTTCKKDDGLPPETQEGKNTFGCKVNGKVWIPNGGPGFMGAKPIEGGFYGISSTQIGIYIRAHAKDGSMVHIYLNDYKPGIYGLTQTTNILPFSSYPKDYALYAISEGNYFTTNSKTHGIITVVRSGPNIDGIVSGTFSFDASNNTSQTVEVTEGRFDINVRTLQ